jgi:hypothetical protein
MKIFDFDPADHRETYASRGWVHIRGGISSEFMSALEQFVAGSLGDHHVEGTSIGGSKDQALFEPPPEAHFPGELFDVIAEMCGLNRSTMTLSERHLKAYHKDTPPEQVAHKDRFASQVSVGLSIDIPEDSRLILYPSDHIGVNPYNVSGALPDSLPPEERPEAVAKTADAVEVDDSAGDVIAFRGSAIWHCRRRAAGAVNLYLKLNDFGCDPLGEDPLTYKRRETTVAALENGSPLDQLVPVLSRRFDHLARVQVRGSWAEVLQAQVFDRTPVQLAPVEPELLRSLDGERTVGELLRVINHDDDGARERVRHLARLEVVDLLAPNPRD